MAYPCDLGPFARMVTSAAVGRLRRPEEVGRFWSTLAADGGARAMQAMMEMVKRDVARLEAAAAARG